MTDKELTFNMTEEDLEKTMTSVIESMSNMRLEAIKNKKISDEQKDEYLHLAFRLATCVNAIAANSETLTKKIDSLIDSVNKNPALLHYDPLQTEHWRVKNVQFKTNLDEVAIAVLRDNLHCFDDTQHLYNAIKCLASNNLPFEKKEKVYNTLVPFAGAVEEKISGIDKTLAIFLGQTYDVAKKDDLTIEINGRVIRAEEMESVVEKAREMGYSNLEVVVRKKDFNALAAKHKAEALRQVKNTGKNDGSIKGVKKFLLYSVYATAPISYTLVGALPRSLQERIDNYFTDRGGLYQGENIHKDSKRRKVCAQSATITSIAITGIIGLGSIIGGVITHTPQIWFPGAMMTVDSVGRLVGAMSTNSYEVQPIGSPIVKAVTFPLEYAINKIDSTKPEDNVLLKARITLRDIVKETGNVPFINIFNYFSDMAKIAFPQEVEENLTWSTANHHSFGKKFIPCFKKETEKNTGDVKIKEYGEKEHSAYVLKHEATIGDYRKFTALVCRQNERYIVSCISNPSEWKDVADMLKAENNLPALLSNAKSAEDKIKEISEACKAKYMHIAKYESGNLASDLEVKN